MTERIPPGMDVETWADRQVREAVARGEFKDLPGFGKPLPGLDRPHDELWWIKEKLRRERLSLLPASLVLRKEAEDAHAAALGARSEGEVRRVLEAINEKIAAALRRPPEGPPLRLGLFDVEEVVREWRRRREGQEERGA
ncbi:DUF1992 domain-containing protein [Streptomyces sp. URMC 126]|uniref:DnaJ family domain-containing protein n=1 Tax=Streptomyces sp. URMC 126 TaxID=3423401 RepID=UPI003F1D7F47